MNLLCFQINFMTQKLLTVNKHTEPKNNKTGYKYILLAWNNKIMQQDDRTHITV